MLLEKKDITQQSSVIWKKNWEGTPWNDKSHSTQLELFFGGHLQVPEDHWGQRSQKKKHQKFQSLKMSYDEKEWHSSIPSSDKTDHNKTWILLVVFPVHKMISKWEPTRHQNNAFISIVQSYSEVEMQKWKWIFPQKTMWSTIQARYAPINMVVKVTDMCTDSWPVNQPHPTFPINCLKEVVDSPFKKLGTLFSRS